VKEIPVQIVSAFTQNISGGNRAGVVLDASALSDLQMQTVAREVGYTETAFIMDSQKADRKIRFFTPNSEVDLCGHATIATYSLLFARSLIGTGKTTHELNAGILDVTIEANGYVTMQQALPVFGLHVPHEEVAQILRIPQEWISSTGLKPQIVSTGLSDVLVPINSRSNLFSIKPDYDRMKEYNRATDTVGFHLFTFDTIADSATAHCRNFAPAYDIFEEAATGSSSGALACYLAEHKPRQSTEYVFEQGYVMHSPSEIVAYLSMEDGNIKSVLVKGSAVLVEERLVNV
jgi:PhzF family phenazine biosynthesis protein